MLAASTKATVNSASLIILQSCLELAYECPRSAHIHSTVFERIRHSLCSKDSKSTQFDDELGWPTAGHIRCRYDSMLNELKSIFFLPQPSLVSCFQSPARLAQSEEI